MTADVANGLWSCLVSFFRIHTLNISDSSLGFTTSPPELPYVTKLEAKRLTSQSYEYLLSSLPGLKEIDITIDDAESDISQITAGLQRTGREQLTHISLETPLSFPSEKKVVSRETMRGLGLLIRERTKSLQRLYVSGVKCRDMEDLVDLFIESSVHSNTLKILLLGSGCGSLNYDKTASQDPNLEINGCLLSAEMTDILWSCFSSFTTLPRLTISDSSLSFPPSPPELPYVTKLTARRVTSQSYEGLLSSLPGLKEIDITIDNTERDISQITAGLQRTGGEQLTHIILQTPPLLPSEKRKVSRETMRGLGLLIREQTKNLHWINVSGLKCRDEEDLVDLADSYINRHVLFWWGTEEEGEQESHLMGLYTSKCEFKVQIFQDSKLVIKECQLSTEMTDRLWSYFRSFTTLPHLTISDSSLSFPSSPPELTYVTKLTAKSVTSQSYEGLLSSLHGLKEIDIIIDNAESDIDQITAGLQRTGREQLTSIRLEALPSQGKGMGCGSLTYYEGLTQDHELEIKDCLLSADITDRLWSYFRSFTTLHRLIISDSSLSFPPYPPELPYVTMLEAKSVTSQSYEGLLSSLPGLQEIDITIDNAESDISQITADLQRTGGEQLTRINLTAPPSLSSQKRKVSRETMRGLGLLIREQTKNLQELYMNRVKCRDEKEWIDLVECCRHVKTMNYIRLWHCGNKGDGRLDSHLKDQQTSISGINVDIVHIVGYKSYFISHAV